MGLVTDGGAWCYSVRGAGLDPAIGGGGDRGLRSFASEQGEGRSAHLMERLSRPGDSPGERSRLWLLVRSPALRAMFSSASSMLGRSGPGTSESVEPSRPSIVRTLNLERATVAWTRVEAPVSPRPGRGRRGRREGVALTPPGAGSSHSIRVHHLFARRAARARKGSHAPPPLAPKVRV